jgi:hypothetical protein
MNKKIDLKDYFTDNLSQLNEMKFLKEFFEKNMYLIKKRNEEVMNKLIDKIIDVIVVFEGDYKINEIQFNFLFEIIELIIENSKRKIGYILLLNPVLNYINKIVFIQKDNISNEEKEKKFSEEKNNLYENLDALLEKNFSNTKSTPYLIEIIELYNDNNKNDEIKNFWIDSFLKGNEEIFEKISNFFKVDKISMNNLENKIEEIKNKLKENNNIIK